MPGSCLPDGYHKDSALQENVEIYSKLYEKSKNRGKGKGKEKGKGKDKGKNKGRDKNRKDSSDMDVAQGTAEQEAENDPDITGYMSSDIFHEWLQRFQHSIVSENPSRRILLLVDNAGCHTKDIQEKAHLFPNIRVQFLPPNSTSVTQPLDAGIIAVFKLRYRQIIGDQTILLRVAHDRAQKKSRGRAANIWNMRISNLVAWNSIVRAWGYVKPESIRNCFRHVPILCNEQKDQLGQITGINDIRTVDPCVYEAVASRRDIEDLIENQTELDAESTLEVPYQYTGMPSSLTSDTSSEERSEWIRTASERDHFYRDAMPTVIRNVQETLEYGRGLRLRAEERIGSTEGAVPRTRLALREAFSSDNSQRVIISDEERNRATTIQAALDGSPLLCRLIEDYKDDETFMSYFRPALEARAETALLGEEWLPSEDELSDEDFFADTDEYGHGWHNWSLRIRRYRRRN